MVAVGYVVGVDVVDAVVVDANGLVGFVVPSVVGIVVVDSVAVVDGVVVVCFVLRPLAFEAS